MTTLMKSNGRKTSDFPSLINDFLSRDLFDWPLEGRQNIASASLPSVNISETADNFQLEVAAPGLEKQDFNIELNNNMLIISAERNEDKEQMDDKYSRREFNYSSFSRSFSLNEKLVEIDKINASYKDGILYITIPKSKDAKVKPARKIKIS